MKVVHRSDPALPCDELLYLFVSPDELRPKMVRPYQVGDVVYATDGNAIIKVPCSNLAIDYIQDYEFYEVDQFFDRSNEDPINVQLDLEALTTWMSGLQMRPVYEECPTCEGSGTITCPCCDSENDCKACDGTGDSDKKIGEVPYGDAYYDIEGVRFGYRNLLRLLEVHKTTGAPIQWLVRNPSKGNLFLINDIEVVLMPMLQF
jgi:hypothetical protein